MREAQRGWLVLAAAVVILAVALVASYGWLLGDNPQTGAAPPSSGTPQPPTPTPTRNPGYITRAEYGDDWPFTVSSGTLVCDPSGRGDGRLLVRLDTGDGIQYALNGSARDFGFPELDKSILPSWPDVSMLGPFIERGLELCE